MQTNRFFKAGKKRVNILIQGKGVWEDSAGNELAGVLPLLLHEYVLKIYNIYIKMYMFTRENMYMDSKRGKYKVVE